MALTRANAVTYLNGQYGTGAQAFLVLANVGLTDVSGGLKEPIDEAWLASGVTFTNLATATIADSDVPDTLALLRYTTLRRILAGLNAEEHRDLAIGDVKLSGSQLISKVEALMSLELETLKARGLVAQTAQAAAYLGGSSISDVQNREFDPDRVPAAFTRETGAPSVFPRWDGN